jgi:hypothetical protein
MMPEAPPEMRGMGWRIPASILIAVGWLAFVIIWLFFFASAYSIYQNIAVLFVSVVLIAVLYAVVWVGYGLRMGQMYAKNEMESVNYRQVRWRVLVNALIVAGWAVFLLVWLFLYADNYSGYQNIAVLFVSLLVAGGLSAVLWARMWPGRRWPGQ